MSRRKKIKTHDLGDIIVSTIQNTSNYSNGSMQIAQDMPMPTILDLSSIIQSLINNAINVNFSYMNTDRDITYDWTRDIESFNQGVYWLWGGVTSGGVGLIYAGYNSSLKKHRWGWICSHGYYTSLNNPQRGRYYIQQLWSAWYVPEISGKSIAFCYYDRSYNSTNLVTPFPAHNFYSNVIILQPTDPNQSTVEGTFLRKKRRIGPSGTPENMTYDIAETEVTTLDSALNPSGVYWQSIPYNIRGWYPDAIITTPSTLWNGSYSAQSILDDDYYGFQGYNHESGHWYGEDVDNDDDDQGGDGDGDNTQFPSDVPTLDDLNGDATDTGFVRIYKPTTAELRGLASFMFSNITDADATQLKKLLANPLDYIIGLNMCHFTPAVGEYEEDVKLGGLSIGDGLGMFPVAKQYVTISGGSYTLVGQKGNYLDYAPFTKIQIYIPYTGMHDLPTDLVQNSTLSLTYIIDLLSGALVAHLSITKSPQFNGEADATNNALVFTYTGNCFTPIPIANTDYRGAVNGMLGLCGGAISSAISGNPMSLFKAGTSAVMNAKPTVQSKVSVANDFGFMSGQTAYLIISRPIESKPSKYYEWVGHMCNRIEPVSYYEGGVLTIKDDSLWTSFDNTNITDTEAQEIRDLFKLGVYV